MAQWNVIGSQAECSDRSEKDTFAGMLRATMKTMHVSSPVEMAGSTMCESEEAQELFNTAVDICITEQNNNPFYS